MSNEKLDKIGADIGEIKVSVAVQAAQLKEHMRRTDLLETRVEQVAASVSPIQTSMAMVQGAVKLGSALLASGSIIVGVFKLWHLFHF